MGFADDVERFAGKSLVKIGDVAKGAALEVAERVVMNTPAATGTARGNWIARLDSNPAGETTGRKDPRGDTTVAEISNVISGFDVRSNHSIWLANSLPYILDLEYGASEQAPNGMVRLAVQSFGDIVQRQAAKLK